MAAQMQQCQDRCMKLCGYPGTWRCSKEEERPCSPSLVLATSSSPPVASSNLCTCSQTRICHCDCIMITGWHASHIASSALAFNSRLLATSGNPPVASSNLCTCSQTRLCCCNSATTTHLHASHIANPYACGVQVLAFGY